MIQMPERSITRFFIPMIDVLTLLFCIYLLMPMVAEPDGTKSDAERRAEELLAELKAARANQSEELLKKLGDENEKLKREKAQTLRSRLSVRVLEIDPADGKLFYRGPKNARLEIRHQADALSLIGRDQEQTGAEKRELYYLILYPRDPKSAYPTVGQKRSYDKWFTDIALGYDVPGLDLGKQP